MFLTIVFFVSVMLVYYRNNVTKAIKNFGFGLTMMLVAVFATGCAFNKPPPPTVVYKTQFIYQEVPERLTKTVTMSRPISKEEYLAMTVYERESYMADYSVQALKSLHKCNAQLGSISELSRRWKESINENQQKD